MRLVNLAKSGAFAALLLGPWTSTGADQSGGALIVQVPLTAKRGAGPALASFIEEGPTTRVVIRLGRTPEGLANPRVIAEISQGTCENPSGNTIFRTEKTVNQHTRIEVSRGAGHELGGDVPVRLSVLRQSAHAVTLRTGPESENRVIACGNIG